MEKGLQNVHLWRVIVSVQLLVVAMFVTEHAARAVHALSRVVEGPAVLTLELIVVDAAGSLCQLLLAMGKPTFVLISALGSLNPILAKLRLILAIRVVLDHLRRRWEGLCWEECLLLARIGIIGSLVAIDRVLLAIVEGLGCYCEALQVSGLEAS